MYQDEPIFAYSQVSFFVCLLYLVIKDFGRKAPFSEIHALRCS